jgi:hypothetical protein
MTSYTDFIIPNQTSQDYAQLCTDAVYKTRAYCKKAELACKWILLIDDGEQHRSNSIAARAVLGEYKSWHYAAFAVRDFFLQFLQGLAQIWEYAACAGVKNISQDMWSVLKNSAGSLLPCFQNIATIILFAEDKKVLSLFHNEVNYETGLSLVLDATYLASSCGSLADKTEKVAKGKRELSLDAVWGVLYDLKLVAVGVADLFSLGQPIPKTAVLAMETMNACYSIGKTIAKEDRIVDHIKKAKAECRALGIHC